MNAHLSRLGIRIAIAALIGTLAGPVLAQNSQVIYDDALENGWVSYGWATLNFSNTSPVYSGAYSISVDAVDYGALYLHHDAFNTGAYSNLTFWINVGSSAGLPLKVQATTNGMAVPTSVTLPSYPANTWAQVSLSWSQLGVSNLDMDGFWIQDNTSSENIFYVDSIQLSALAPPAVVHLNVNPGQVVRTVDARHYGVNTATWDYNLDSAASISLLEQMGAKILRFPGGSTADAYNWQVNTGGGTSFSEFANVATNVGAQAFITVNYGSGTAQEAAAWVADSNVTNHYGFKYWEIGNENYGDWETDTNALPNDPYTYAVHAQQYYTLMKAQDPTIKIGVPLVTGEDSYANYTNHWATNMVTGQIHYGWTPVVLTTLQSLGVTPDFLIYHRYDEEPGEEDDAGLLQSSATWTNDAADLRGQLTDYIGSAGSNVELLCTENNSVSYNTGKQTTSLVDALFFADSLGNILQTEFNSRVWWDLRNGQSPSNNNSSALYGWREYGDYGLLYNTTNCYPTFYMSKLLQNFAQAGDQVVSASSDFAFMSLYAARRTNGSLTLMIINKSSNNTYNASIALNGYFAATNATAWSYGMPQDNAAKTGVGSPDVAQSNVVAGGSNFSMSFAPYSVTVLALFPPAAPRLSLASYATNGQFHFEITGQSNATYVIQGSTNFTTWVSLATNSLTNGVSAWTDLQSPGLASRFYRAVWLP